MKLPEKYGDRLALTVPELARLVGLSADTIKNEIRMGKLDAIQVGGGIERKTWIVPIHAVEGWLKFVQTWRREE